MGSSPSALNQGETPSAPANSKTDSKLSQDIKNQTKTAEKEIAEIKKDVQKSADIDTTMKSSRPVSSRSKRPPDGRTSSSSDAKPVENGKHSDTKENGKSSDRKLSTAAETKPVENGKHSKPAENGDAKSVNPPKRGGFKEVQLENPTDYRPPSRGTPTSRPATAPHPSAKNGTSKSSTPPSQNGVSNGNAGSSPHAPAESTAPASSLNVSAAERHAVVGRMQREKTMAPNITEPPKYSDGTEMAFETFYHKNGQQYTVVYQNKERYIVDVRNRKQIPFPKPWYTQGLFVTDQQVGGTSNQRNSEPPNLQQFQQDAVQFDLSSDDRAGYIDHPTKGRLQTYIAQEKRNVHRYYDPDQGEWIALPIGWELHSPSVSAQLSTIEEALPDWKDKFDMLASLRAANYNPDECISSFFAVGDVNALPSVRTTKDAHLLASQKKKISELDDQVKSLQEKLKLNAIALQQERITRQQAEANELKSQDKAATLEARLAQVAANLSSMKREKTMIGQPLKNASSSVSRDTIAAASKETRELHKDHVNLRQQVQNLFSNYKQNLDDLKRSLSQLNAADTGSSAELETMKDLYRREVLQRKLLYNQLQELRGNIRVFCRTRNDTRVKCCLKFPTDQDVLPPGSKKPFQFDKVFTPSSTQEEVYEDTKPIITSCVDGYNVCILAYGQTGSGKTFTMQGPPKDPGVNVRSVMDLLEICKSRDNVEYSLNASMVEIYNETIHDLLSPSVAQLDIRAQGNKIQLPGMVEMPVKSIDDVENIMKTGGKNRATAATKMNSESSRSHLIFMITVRGKDKSTGSISTGTLTLCDLAGSERVSKSEATGQRLVEAAAINKSLSALGQVFTALRTGQLHVPYRNSKLTHILQPSLGGDAKACLFVMTSPDQNNLSETLSTLQFGSSAQQIALGQAKKNVTKGPQQP